MIFITIYMPKILDLFIVAISDRKKNGMSAKKIIAKIDKMCSNLDGQKNRTTCHHLLGEYTTVQSACFSDSVMMWSKMLTVAWLLFQITTITILRKLYVASKSYKK